MPSALELLEAAQQSHQRGELTQARMLYRQSLDAQASADAYHWLGVLELQSGQPAEAVAALHQAVTLDSSSAPLQANYGNALAAVGRLDEAESALRASLALNPSSPETLATLGNVLVRKQQPKAALEQFRQALALAPTPWPLVLSVATTLLTLGRAQSALDELATLERWLEQHGQAPPPELLMTQGNALMALSRVRDAEEHFARVTAVAPEVPDGFVSLGHAQRALGESDQAVRSYQRALDLEPAHVEALFSVGLVRQEQGQLDEAARWLRQTLSAAPEHGRAHRLLASLQRYTSDSPHLEAMRERLTSTSMPDRDRAHLHLALGKALGDCGEYEQAFEHIAQGNALHRGRLNYSVDQDIRDLRALARQRYPQAEPTEQTARLTDRATPVPMFIVGMPRSGTSLIEQILASHSQVHGAGELEAFEQCLVEAQLTPARLRDGSRLSHDELAQRFADVGRAYLEQLSRLSTKPYVVDKMPANFRHIGAIRAALPEAKIIHAQRHPMATCWSVYKHFLGTQGHAYSFDLDELGRYYAAYARLMAHFSSGQSDLVELRYETLVADQAAATRRLLEQLDLPWEDACLDFHRTRRPVRTLSAAQVRRPMYTDSLADWQRYEPWLQPLKQALASGDSGDA